MNTNVFRNLSYGVYIVSTLDGTGTRPTGCVANSIMQITSSPATIALSMNHDNYTNSCIKKSGIFALSIMAESSDPGIIGTFGFQSGKDVNKFDHIPYSEKEGLPVLKDSCGYITCRVINTMETSSHTVFLGEVTNGDVIRTAPPMTYSYYHTVVKGKSPKNAPTYLPEEETAEPETKEHWVCSVCGYIYDGDTPFEELPDDYACPVCRQPKSAFIKK